MQVNIKFNLILLIFSLILSVTISIYAETNTELNNSDSINNLVTKTNSNGLKNDNNPKLGIISPSELYTYVLASGDYDGLFYPNGLSSVWDIHWSFSGSDSRVGIEFLAMDDYNFGLWSSYSLATVYTLSDGSSSSDKGVFSIPYSDIWYLIAYNRNNPIITSVSINVDARVPANLDSVFVDLSDTDGDQIDDKLSVISDPDLPSGVTGEVDMRFELHTISDDLFQRDIVVDTISVTKTITGTNFDQFTVDFPNISFLDTDFHIYATIKYVPFDQTIFCFDSCPDDTYQSNSFTLGGLGIGFPTFGDYYGNTYDTDLDGLSDTVIAFFTPDLDSKIITSVTVKMELIQDSTLSVVSTQTGVYPTVDGAYPSELQLDMGTVNSDGAYHLEGTMYLTNSPSTQDNVKTTSANLYTLGSGFTTWYPDSDGDGYGDQGSQGTVSSTAPSGYVEDNNDCNDNDASIYPGATEINDGKDNNCNGQVDEGIPTSTWYPDSDGDNYGDAGSQGTVSSNAPNGYVSNNNDCNDNDASIHPGATEVNDGKDNNCDGQVDEGFGTTETSETDNTSNTDTDNTSNTDTDNTSNTDTDKTSNTDTNQGRTSDVNTPDSLISFNVFPSMIALLILGVGISKTKRPSKKTNSRI